MSRAEQCPVCFGELEARQVQPCFVCGGWPDVPPSKPERHFVLRDSGAPLTLCNFCWLEEVLSDQGNLKQRLGISGENDLTVTAEQPAPSTDKFCPACNYRLALLRLMAQRLSDEQLARWRK